MRLSLIRQTASALSESFNMVNEILEARDREGRETGVIGNSSKSSTHQLQPFP